MLRTMCDLVAPGEVAYGLVKHTAAAINRCLDANAGEHEKLGAKVLPLICSWPKFGQLVSQKRPFLRLYNCMDNSPMQESLSFSKPGERSMERRSSNHLLRCLI